MLRYTPTCGSCKALTQPNRDRQGATTQEVTAAEGSRFLTGMVRISHRNTCDTTLVLCYAGIDGGLVASGGFVVCVLDAPFSLNATRGRVRPVAAR